jgi:hypothetical protein
MYIQNKTPPLFEQPKIYDHVTKLVEEVQAQFIWANPINLSYLNQNMNFLPACVIKELQNFLDLLDPKAKLVLRAKVKHA